MRILILSVHFLLLCYFKGLFSLLNLKINSINIVMLKQNKIIDKVTSVFDYLGAFF